jgi:uncharacterized membrane protein YcaP (DUF421 family)
VISAILLHAVYALMYYGALVVIVRVVGKRLTGQTATFDLIVLIQLAVVLQSTAFQEGFANAVTFIGTVLTAHLVLAAATARVRWLRRLVRGAARPLVRDGQVSFDALAEERLSYEDLLAGLRKLGHDSPQGVKLAVLEETGHISAVGKDRSPS